tara:strand:+ start:306 stop:521 length:216 start_codon:yes stop_codon:yes gene_type:complete
MPTALMGREVMMNKVMAVKDWIMARIAERTSWDGATIIGGSVLILVGAPIIKLLAWPALAWGIYTLVMEQS